MNKVELKQHKDMIFNVPPEKFYGCFCINSLFLVWWCNRSHNIQQWSSQRESLPCSSFWTWVSQQSEIVDGPVKNLNPFTLKSGCCLTAECVFTFLIQVFHSFPEPSSDILLRTMLADGSKVTISQFRSSSLALMCRDILDRIMGCNWWWPVMKHAGFPHMSHYCSVFV